MTDDGKRKLNFKKSRGPLELNLDELAKLGNEAAVKAGMVPPQYAERAAAMSSPAVDNISSTSGSPHPLTAAQPTLPVKAPDETRAPVTLGAPVQPPSAPKVSRDRVNVSLPGEIIVLLKYAAIDRKTTVGELIEVAVIKHLGIGKRD